MGELVDYYQLFGVAQTASMSQISQAYLQLCKRYKSTGGFGHQEFSFDALQTAYKTLSDVDLRRFYDESLVKDEILQENIISAAQSGEPVAEKDWTSKDYTGVKEWVHDFRTPYNPHVAQTAEDFFSSTPDSHAVPVSSVARPTRANYAEPTTKTSTGRNVFIALLIFFACSGIPAGATFLTALGLNATLAHLYSILGAAIFSIACLKTSPASSSPATTTVRKRQNYRGPTQKVYQSLSPAVRRNLMDADFALKCKIWGMPGVLDDAVEKFGQHNVDLGAAGEEITAQLLEDLLKLPGTRIFHGLKFPGSENADVDHAIINGNKIVFIDSKMWVGAHYKWIRPDTIGRVRRKEFKEIHTNFPEALGYLAQTFNKQQIMAMTIIHPNNQYRVSFDNSKASGVLLINGQDAIRDIGNWFSEDLTGKIDLNAMQKLEYQLK